ncbi:MAG: hypothetical protein LLG08_01410 [Actinomycetia bacterium]|nr:hypothetical protein [Actinomycetes bacterium]
MAFGLDPESLGMLFGISLWPLIVGGIGGALSLSEKAGDRRARPLLLGVPKGALLLMGPAATLPFLTLLLVSGNGRGVLHGLPVLIGIVVLTSAAGPMQAALTRSAWERKQVQA